MERTQGPQARRALVKPLLGLFAGEPNGKSFRNRLDQLLLVQRKAVDMDLRQVIMGAAEVLSAGELSLWGVFLYTASFSFHVEWCIRQL